MKCPKCNMNIRDDARFCIHCGEQFNKNAGKVYCTKCGTKIREGNNFCTNCGKSVFDDKTDHVNNSISIIKEKVIKVDKVDDKPLAKEGLIIGLVLCVLVVSITSIFIVSYYARDYEPKYYIQ